MIEETLTPVPGIWAGQWGAPAALTCSVGPIGGIAGWKEVTP